MPKKSDINGCKDNFFSWTGAGMALGSGAGVAVGTGVGAATGNMGFWIAIGVAIGAAIGMAIGSALSQGKGPKDGRTS